MKELLPLMCGVMLPVLTACGNVLSVEDPEYQVTLTGVVTVNGVPVLAQVNVSSPDHKVCATMWDTTCDMDWFTWAFSKASDGSYTVKSGSRRWTSCGGFHVSFVYDADGFAPESDGPRYYGSDPSTYEGCGPHRVNYNFVLPELVPGG